MRKLIFLFLLLFVSCKQNYTNEHLIIKKVTFNIDSEYTYKVEIEACPQNFILYTNTLYKEGDTLKVCK